MLLEGRVSRCVDVRDEELYLVKDVIDHLINLLRRHRFGVLGCLYDIRAKGLDVQSQRILGGRQCKWSGILMNESNVRCQQSHPFRCHG